MEYEFAAVDIETTGLDPYSQGIYEIAVVRVKNGEVVEEYSSFIRTTREVSYHILERRGITQGHLKMAPTYHEVLTKFLDIVKGIPIVAHNKELDERFIAHKIWTKLNRRVQGPFICTLANTRKQYPDLPSYKLGAVATHFGITNARPHEALSDARVCADIMVCLLGGKPFVTLPKKEIIEGPAPVIKFTGLKFE